MVPLTLGLRLPVEVVEQLGVAGEHAAAGGAGHHLLLGVAPQVLPQTVPDLKEGVATCNPEGIGLERLEGSWWASDRHRGGATAQTPRWIASLLRAMQESIDWRQISIHYTVYIFIFLFSIFMLYS